MVGRELQPGHIYNAKQMPDYAYRQTHVQCRKERSVKSDHLYRPRAHRMSVAALSPDLTAPSIYPIQ